MQLPKNFDDRHWWIPTMISGALIAVASAPVGFTAGFVIGLALLLFGIGQWVDHPLQVEVGRGMTFTSYPWRPTGLGAALSVGGAAFFAFGVYALTAR